MKSRFESDVKTTMMNSYQASSHWATMGSVYEHSYVYFYTTYKFGRHVMPKVWGCL